MQWSRSKPRPESLSVFSLLVLLATFFQVMMIGGVELSASTRQSKVHRPVNPFPDCTQNGRDFLDVPYWNTADDPDRQMLDLFLPDSGGPFPVVVFFHGGGFLWGDKDDVYWADFHEYLNANGIAYALVNYRYSTEYPFRLGDPASTPYPVSMWDSARAIQTFRY